ncbi:hypothetical protein [Dyella sedimenti]|jgi:hypothetical protein|uniref:hypothetical protein n=1 Tax=Dyella sedimenti TaxID=2919947 RepID=UPI001FA9C0AD|nr:hypothetical protein [Dyella sedimenti]
MHKTTTTLKRDLTRLEVDAATLHRHYAGSADFAAELSGLARDILLNASEQDQAWVRSAIDRILARYEITLAQLLNERPVDRTTLACAELGWAGGTAS